MIQTGFISYNTNINNYDTTTLYKTGLKKKSKTYVDFFPNKLYQEHLDIVATIIPYQA
jgi:hypothetical protein